MCYWLVDFFVTPCGFLWSSCLCFTFCPPAYQLLFSLPIPNQLLPANGYCRVWGSPSSICRSQFVKMFLWNERSRNLSFPWPLKLRWDNGWLSDLLATPRTGCYFITFLISTSGDNNSSYFIRLLWGFSRKCFRSPWHGDWFLADAQWMKALKLFIIEIFHHVKMG